MGNELTKLKAQRDRAWRALQALQDVIAAGNTNARVLALHLAGCIGPTDADEWNAVDRERLARDQPEVSYD